ncbi:DEAD/DEAH box helicase [Staphylococcus lutrae]|uniref:DEAD/DEAH box helicase n=1 Tax=Staphylococcus lutrae TaxID=155085 RepID=A0AAC9RRC4_9STAP|nr:DEAD/DEAH box helicase [Staphylococcus lutrae]ARJ49869.1 DEAD/DEAH box helicase [Staphylococcus lutrae]PNZ37768.1 ATP-dependent helicase [Staphylococcus lutrae]
MAKHPFDQFRFDSELIEAISALNFNQPTEIQQRVIPKIMKRVNLIGQSQTGTGKSHAFLLPIFQQLDVAVHEPQAIIVAPTRELATQLYQAAVQLSEYKKDVKVSLFIGGTDFDKDKQKTTVQPQLVIGTPTRINDLAKIGVLHVHLAHQLVIDEADLMIDLGLIQEVDQIAAKLDNDAKMAVFSATIPKSLHPFLNKYLEHPEFVEVKSEAKNKKSIEFYLIPTKGTQKIEKAVSLLNIINPYLAIIFCNSRESANQLSNELQQQGIQVGMIHGGLTPRERKQQMKRIRNLDFQYVIASDLASRGIDIEGVSHVINFDVPKDIDFFTHRVGRTGRGNYKGVAMTLYTPEEAYLIEAIENKGYHFENVDIINGELKPIKAHNTRQLRKKQDDHITQQVKHKVKRNTKKKVKPGYKKKFQQELEQLKRQEKRQFSRRKNRQSRKK